MAESVITIPETSSGYTVPTMADATSSKLDLPQPPAPQTPAPPPLPLQLSHPARLSLGNPSPALSTRDHLRFQLDHALARDAVHTPLDLAHLREGLAARSLTALPLHSAAPDRKTYLRRPDLGRTLSTASIAELQNAVILSG
jgi:ethanolamine ammonia-lyase small subunit